MGVIYKLTNTINGKIYIGKTIFTSEKRWADHIRESQNNQNSILNRAISKYGANSFLLDTLEQCENYNLNNREKYYIALYNSYYLYGHGYNMTLGGDGSAKYSDEEILQLWNQGLLVSEIALQLNCTVNTVTNHLYNFIDKDTIKQRQNKKQEKAVEQYSTYGDFIQIWPSATIAGKTLNIGSSHIGNCCQGRQISAYGFLWKFSNDNKPVSQLVDEYILSSNCKDVYEITKNKQIIKWYNSPREAEISLSITKGKVSAICNFNPGTHSASGHYFMWANERKRQLLKLE